MQIRQFEYVREIAQQGSIKVAAEKLYISQQALSESLRSLEDELEFQIFQRTNRGAVLTEKGEKFLNDINTIMPIVYSWNEYKEKVQVKLLLQNVLSDMLLDQHMMQYLLQMNDMEIHSETSNLAGILEEALKGNMCLSFLIVRDRYNTIPQLAKVKASNDFALEELVGLEGSQMCILMQKNEDTIIENGKIDLSQLKGKTLVVNKDMVNLHLVKLIERYSHRAVHGLPYTVKAVDVVAHNTKAITFLPKFLAEKNFYVKSGLLSVYPIKQCESDEWHCYLLYGVQWKRQLKSLIKEIKSIFAE